ncbi:PhzF family phenazine biosynthesis protein [Oryzibacter oryziterrae]|uniref:PhzF family phenazine biosynthesis protein n=1 Tax=Oryzibacter oryziterrae TaxID=2766474 RepID=UPI001F3F9BE8|nr:PhzF family phenazine biosynthesis protein [Oryzibacter oryziterrae]
MARRYAVLDVFTSHALSGNPLAVVLDCEGLDTEAMQTITREFNLSETVFVEAPSRPGTSAKIRIFTLNKELPFAGHPTVGTAVLLAHERLKGVERDTDAMVVLEEQVGTVRCGAVVKPDGSGKAVFDLPRLPEEQAFHGDVGLAASALGLNRGDIGFENHAPSVFNAGGPTFVFVPLSGLDAMRRIRRDMSVWSGAFGEPSTNIFAYTRECVNKGHDFHARMFAPDLGLGEDPATGSAAAAFAGVIKRFDRPSDGERKIVIEQGYEMGRPSLIELEIILEKGKLTGGRLGGNAKIIARGELYV